MKKDIKYLIIPDIHGRDFWMTPVEDVLKNYESQVVFLGDYLDPYPHEWDAGIDYRQLALNRFKLILEIKKQYPGRVTLLLGNHDCGYAIGSDICDCRTDYDRYREIESLFQDNRELFQIAEECHLGGRHFIFSHAGILKGWVDQIYDIRDIQSSPVKYNPVNYLNNAWLTEDYQTLNHLGDYDRYRGYLGYKYGSPVWSDIRSWQSVTEEETFGYNICGHTQLNYPVVLDQITCLDCRKTFFLDEEGILRDYDSGEEVKNPEV